MKPRKGKECWCQHTHQLKVVLKFLLSVFFFATGMSTRSKQMLIKVPTWCLLLLWWLLLWLNGIGQVVGWLLPVVGLSPVLVRWLHIVVSLIVVDRSRRSGRENVENGRRVGNSFAFSTKATSLRATVDHISGVLFTFSLRRPGGTLRVSVFTD